MAPNGYESDDTEQSQSNGRGFGRPNGKNRSQLDISDLNIEEDQSQPFLRHLQYDERSDRRNSRRGRYIGPHSMGKWTRWLYRSNLLPRGPYSIVMSLSAFAAFALIVTLILKYILNPDKEALPWRGYCTYPELANPAEPNVAPPEPPQIPFPPDNLDSLPPAGVLLGVFSFDSGYERRSLIRTTFASHLQSRNGAGTGDNGLGTSRTIVRFILGKPRKEWERRIQMEMDIYNDIVILPINENMNGGKTHAFFTWAAANAWVPPIYNKDSKVPPLSTSYANITNPRPPLAGHDSRLCWDDLQNGKNTPWVRPDFVVKMDDDAFVVLAELEARLRAYLYAKHASTQWDPLIYWGYLVRNRLHRFMAGELYGLSWSLVSWVATDSKVKSMITGKEDKQTAKWMSIHPKASDIRWASERCWIYDHPRGGTVYSHGFLFPSEVERIRKAMPKVAVKAQDPAPASWAYSTVSTFGSGYTAPVDGLNVSQSIEAMVEGSPLSVIKPGETIEAAWERRERGQERFNGKRVGGTVGIHFIKKSTWYMETAMALLGELP